MAPGSSAKTPVPEYYLETLTNVTWPVSDKTANMPARDRCNAMADTISQGLGLKVGTRRGQVHGLCPSVPAFSSFEAVVSSEKLLDFFEARSVESQPCSGAELQLRARTCTILLPAPTQPPFSPKASRVISLVHLSCERRATAVLADLHNHICRFLRERRQAPSWGCVGTQEPEATRAEGEGPGQGVVPEEEGPAVDGEALPASRSGPALPMSPAVSDLRSWGSDRVPLSLQ